MKEEAMRSGTQSHLTLKTLFSDSDKRPMQRQSKIQSTSKMVCTRMKESFLKI